MEERRKGILTVNSGLRFSTHNLAALATDALRRIPSTSGPGLSPIFEATVNRRSKVNRYSPHQGTRECARRRRHMEKTHG